MEKPLYKLEVFEGPLDLLLHLISKHKININDIPIVELVEQYMRYIEQMRSENMELASEFLEMAARLVYIKTAALLPVYEQADKLKKELEGELIEYRDLKLMAKKLEERGRGVEKLVREPQEIEQDMTYSRLHDALELYSAYIRAAGKRLRKIPLSRDDFKDIVERAVVSVSVKIDSLLALISSAGSVRVLDAFAMSKSRSELVASFLAILEMAKNGQIYLTGEGEELYMRLDRAREEADENGAG